MVCDEREKERERKRERIVFDSLSDQPLLFMNQNKGTHHEVLKIILLHSAIFILTTGRFAYK